MMLLAGLITCLAAGSPNFHRPVWSQDGSRLAFMSDAPGNWELFVMDRDGSGVKRLTDDPAFDGYATWSPDGRFLIFGRSGALIHYDFQTGRERPFLPEGVRPEEGKEDLSAQWSPKGDWVAFVSDRAGNRDIYLVKPDGTGLRRLTEGPEDEGSPSFSPDGGRLAMFAAEEGSLSLRIVALKSGEIRTVHKEPGPGYGLAWSPDGRFLAFNAERDGNMDLYVLDLESGAARRLTDQPGTDHLPVWYPDGKHLIYTSEQGDLETVFRISIQGGNPERVAMPELSP